MKGFDTLSLRAGRENQQIEIFEEDGTCAGRIILLIISEDVMKNSRDVASQGTL
jgi:hypothetical protein